MENTASLDYLILACALSPLQARGVPFVVILRPTGGDPEVLKVYVLNGWHDKPASFPQDVHESLDSFLQDLERFHLAADVSTQAFVEGLVDLGIGVIRTFAHGTAKTDELDGLFQTLFAGLAPAVSWPQSFKQSLVGRSVNIAASDGG